MSCSIQQRQTNKEANIKTTQTPFRFFVGAIIALFVLSVGIVATTLLMPATPVSAATGINHQINFQGKLVNPNGTNVTDGSYSIVFSIYNVASAGSALWTETQTVTLSNGIFQVNLGSVTALPGTIDFNTDNIYLGIKVGADAEMTPRVQFTAVPQAFNAEKLGGIDKTGFIQNTTTPQTASFNITGAGTIGTTLTVASNTTVGGTLAVTGVVTGGTYNGQTISSAASLTGTLAVAGALTGASTVQGSQLIATTATGFAPLVVSSTTLVTNLNADLLDGQHASAFAPVSGSANYIENTTTLQTANFNISGNGSLGGNLTVGTGASPGAPNVVQITSGGASPFTNRLTYGTDGSGYKFAISKNQAGTLTDQLVLQDNGNVGIGTTAPSQKLDVQGGNINTSGSILTGGTARLDASGNLTNIGAITANTANISSVNVSDQINLQPTSGSSQIAFNYAGKANANFNFYNGSGAGASVALINGTNGNFSNNGTIVSSGTGNSSFAGNVGIGTTTSSQKLTVSSGNILVDGNGSGQSGGILLQSGTSYGGAFRNGGQINVTGNLAGRLLNRNAEMLDGTVGYTVYDNSAGGHTSISTAVDANAPNTSGNTLRVSYDGLGTYNTNPTPGYGGFYLAYLPCAGANNAVSGYCYRPNSRNHIRIWANIPVGYTLQFNTNPMGTGGNYVWLTSQSGTGGWQEYDEIATLGVGSSSTFFWSLTGPTGAAAFNWNVASVQIVALDEAPSVQSASNLNVGYYQGANLDYGQFLTTGASYLAVTGGNVGIGTTTPSQKLDVQGGNINTSGSILTGGTNRIDASGNLTNITSLSVGSGFGSTASAVLKSSAGALGTTAGNELAVASFGFSSSNASSLTVRAYRAASGTDWTTTNLVLGMDVDNTVRAGTSGSSYLTLGANGNTGISTLTPSQKLDVQGGNINTSGSILTGGTARLDASGNLSNIGTITASGAVTAGTYNGQTISSAASLTGTLAVTGSTTLSSNLSVSGPTVLSGTVSQGNQYPSQSFITGGGTDTNWQKAVSVTTPTGLYTGVSFEVDVTQTQSNYGAYATILPLKYFVSILRSTGVQDDTLAATVSGPLNEYVRVVKVSTTAWELQIHQPGNYQIVNYHIKELSNNNTALTWGPVADSASVGTIYTPTVIHTDTFSNVSAAGTLAVTGAATLNSTLAVTGSSTFTGALTANGGLTVASSETINTSVTNDTSANSFFIYGGADATLGPLGLGFGTHPSATGANRYSYISTGDSVAMRNLALDTNGVGAFGNVGIGTVSPSQRLDVQGGNINTSGSILTGGTARIDAVGNLSNIGNISFTAANPTLTASSYITIPGGAYFNSGTVYTEGAIQARGGIHNDNGAALTLSGGTSGYTYVNGSLGIGTTTPSQKLDVQGGNINTSGQFISTVATGTAPFVVASTTKVTNLNADLLDGLDSTAFGDATAANQTTILNRIGTNADASGTTTLFARLASIDTTKLGTTADASSPTGSIFARLTNIISGVNTVNTSLGTTADAASTTGSVFARLASLITNIGAPTDTASSSGSLFAQVRDIRANLTSGSKTFHQQVITSSGTWVTPAGVSSVDVVVIGGGGGGSGGFGGAFGGGGGGSGFAIKATSFAVSGSVSVSIGSGGTAGGSSGVASGDGASSSFGAVTAHGGAGGGLGGRSSGGSGGGYSSSSSSSSGAAGGGGGSGGGGGNSGSSSSPGGSGGYSGSGGAHTNTIGGGGGGSGGAGAYTFYTNSTYMVPAATGGAGDTDDDPGGGAGGGYTFGGQAGSAAHSGQVAGQRASGSVTGDSAAANSGGGGGGGGSGSLSAGGSGGSGVVIVTWYQ